MTVKDKENKNVEYENKRNRFVAIDFETMEYYRASVCSLAIAVIENNKIVKKFYSTICPPSKNEEYHCVKTHGLHYRDVKNSPDFPTVWEKIDKIIDGCPLIAHNAPFERSCINACNELFGTNNEYYYIDTIKLSKKYLKNLENYKLDTVCESIKHDLKNHHCAEDDAIAAAKIFIKLNKKYMFI